MSKSPANTFSNPEWLDYLNRMLPAYEFESFIAQGGMGAVFKARQRSLDRDVAIKILSMDLRGDESFRTSFETEARAMARLNHPNLISVYASGEVDGMPFIVMEYVPGKSLYHSAYGKRVDPAEAVRIIRDICLGLAHAHENGVIHRDIKPANILLTPKAEPKIGDFGLALPHGSTATGPAMGTPGYTAPEVFEHPESADRRADLFAVGAILYELVSGKRPDGNSKASEELKDCPASLQSICRRALHPNAQLRYPDARAMAAALEEWQRQQATAGSPSRPQRAAGPSAAAPPATGGNIPAAGGPAKRPDRSLTPVVPQTPTTRAGLHDNWYLLIRILLLTAMVGSIPFTYKALIRYREKREEEKTRLDEESARKEKHSASKPHNTPKTPPPPQPADQTTQPPPAPVAHKAEQPLEALSRLRDRLKSGKRDEYPTGTVEHGDCHYFLVTQPMSWLTALGFADNHGGHLAIPTNTDDLSWLASQTGESDSAWLGLGKNPDNQWLLADGTPWKLTTPSGSNPFASISRTGSLVSADASQRLPFLIQWHTKDNPARMGDVYQRLLQGNNPTWPPGTSAYQSHHYLPFLVNTRWENAKNIAHKLGGHLVTVANAEEANWLKSLIANNSIETALWTGGRYHDNHWTWASNEQWQPSGWFVDDNVPEPNSYLLLDPVRGFVVNSPRSPTRGFVIEWGEDSASSVIAPPVAKETPLPKAPDISNNTESTKPQPIAPGAPMPEEALALEPRAKQLIAAAAKERDDQLKANAKQFGWDIDVWVRSLSKSDLAIWQQEAAALKLLVRGQYVPEELPESAGIRLSPQMGKVAAYCATKQRSIEAGFLAKARKIQEAYLAKLNNLANSESSLGHEDNAQRLHDMESSSTDLEAWIRTLGYPLRSDRNGSRR